MFLWLAVFCMCKTLQASQITLGVTSADNYYSSTLSASTNLTKKLTLSMGGSGKKVEKVNEGDDVEASSIRLGLNYAYSARLRLGIKAKIANELYSYRSKAGSFKATYKLQRSARSYLSVSSNVEVQNYTYQNDMSEAIHKRSIKLGIEKKFSFGLMLGTDVTYYHYDLYGNQTKKVFAHKTADDDFVDSFTNGLSHRSNSYYAEYELTENIIPGVSYDITSDELDDLKSKTQEVYADFCMGDWTITPSYSVSRTTGYHPSKTYSLSIGLYF